MNTTLIFISIFLMSCTGGSGQSGTLSAVNTSSHSDIANSFVKSLNLDEDFEVELVKSDTEQQDFIVIYDPYTKSYDAINLKGYNPRSSNPVDFYYSTDIFADLIKEPGKTDFISSGDYGGRVVQTPDRYRDYNTGIVFEKTQSGSKDLAKLKALSESLKLKRMAEYLTHNLGLSYQRSFEIAKLQKNWNKMGTKSMTSSEVDKYSMELLGFSLTEFKKDLEDRDLDSTLDEVLEKTAHKNDITPEHARTLLNRFAR